MPTHWGNFQIAAFAYKEDENMPHLLLKHPEMDPQSPVTIRIHSECLTGDIFHSKKCDCGDQLDKAMQIISEEKGALIYLRQEGRGIGIINKLKAYKKQEEGLNTIEANLVLGFEADERDFSDAIRILEEEKITQIHLLTNNPLKLNAFDTSSVEVISRLPIEIIPNTSNRAYLETKKERMGHLLDLLS